jgi:hypothetical protein
MLLLTGPTGENMAGWRYNADAPKLSCDTGAPAGSGPSACTLTHVSGGTLVRQAGSTPASPDQQQLIFRAANGNEFSLSYQPSHNGPSGTGMTDDAFVAMATNPAIGGVVAEVDGLIVKSS